MSKATLMYVINNNNSTENLKLESESLYYIDNYTRAYKNEDEFIKNYYNKDKIYSFIRQNGNNKGKLVVNFTKASNDKEDLQPLFNSTESFFFEDKPYEGKITDIEKARKLLFNSKNQLFTRLIITNNILDKQLNKLIDLTEEENDYLTKSGIRTIYLNNKHYISFKSLFEYRIKSQKLGFIRNVYQEMLNIIKSRLMNLDDNMFYFYNRQLRIMINKYNDLISSMSVHNLKIKKVKNCNYIINKSNLKKL